MTETKETWWVALWTKGKIVQEYIAGPFDNEEDARYEAVRQVQVNPENSVVGLCTSIPQPKQTNPHT